MSITERKQRQKEELKRYILAAARDLLVEKGINEISLRNIARRVEYSPTTIYLYYKDKDEIIQELYREGFILLNQELQDQPESANSFERLKGICRSYIRFALNNAKLYDLMFMMHSPLATFQKGGRGWFDGCKTLTVFIDAIKACVADSHLPEFQPEAFALTIWSLLHGISAFDIAGLNTMVSEDSRQFLIHNAANSLIEILERMPKIQVQNYSSSIAIS